jgi:hypothetical protein
MLIFGVIYLILNGLAIEFNKPICSYFNLKCELKGGSLMKIIIISFVVGNSALGVRFSHLEE